jgi:hypothetical protein
MTAAMVRRTGKRVLRRRGFSYVEALVAVAVLATGLVPATDALRSAVQGSSVYVDRAASARGLANKMEEVVGRPYAVLDFAANGASSSATVPVRSPRDAGNPGLDPGPGYSDANYTVYVYRTDGQQPKAKSNDTGMLWVTVVDAYGKTLDAIVAR